MLRSGAQEDNLHVCKRTLIPPSVSKQEKYITGVTNLKPSQMNHIQKK